MLEKKHVAAEEYSLEMIPCGGHVCFGERGRERERASECVFTRLTLPDATQRSLIQL